jgi:hypothetical protein
MTQLREGNDSDIRLAINALARKRGHYYDVPVREQFQSMRVESIGLPARMGTGD